ncbi:hypothetical protein ASG43_18440 [Aureimonas sp. Leaf454]|uniref:DUF192 domain-containing protein n=1 Tax=Aureimonas sp. Leaf454 TaxID=1736381 RepID=UPI0006FB6813|nr:DUF192 domain-containing protein [Aureimonas sp. Leaf454]KQT53206.1 hypothetical protein ASG43_18440 [Aureimonas sp. Leaf454]
MPGRTRRRSIAFIAGLLALIGAGTATLYTAMAGSAGTLVTQSAQHSIDVEVADTPDEREYGLMNRQSMPADAGMLFDFEADRPVTMWMKDTYIPLDMVFMDAGGRITRIAANAQPLSLDLIESGGPVRYVLELNGGAAARYGLKAGDRLDHPLIGRKPADP